MILNWYEIGDKYLFRYFLMVRFNLWAVEIARVVESCHPEWGLKCLTLFLIPLFFFSDVYHKN